MAKIKITQIRSIIGARQSQKSTMVALGLKKINQTVEHESSPQILGMVKKIQHLVSFKQI